MEKRLLDELRTDSKQPAIIYCIDSHQVFASRRATTLALRHRGYLGHATVHALDAFPEPGQLGWRIATDEFITSRLDESTGRTQFGVRLADGQVRWQ